MSRSNKSETAVNPAVKFIEWNSEKGCFKYYDKATKKNIDIPLPTKFYVLDILKTIKGFSDSTQNGIWSNEVKNLSKHFKGFDKVLVVAALKINKLVKKIKTILKLD